MAEVNETTSTEKLLLIWSICYQYTNQFSFKFYNFTCLFL